VRNGAGTPFVVFCSPTFFCARETATQFLSSGTKKRRQPFIVICHLPKKVLGLWFLMMRRWRK
jgi:hypothetical protein